MLEVRARVRDVPEYFPPLSERTGLRLDFNENTAGCSPRVLARLRSIGPDDLARYPERAPVERLAADFLRLARDQVLLTNGVDEAIHLLCEAYLDPGSEVIVAAPSFAMYEVYAGATGAAVIKVAADSDFTLPVERLAAAVSSRTRMIALANPNNPTGATIAKSDLIRIAETASHAAVLVDEAYFDFYGVTMIDELERLPNLFVSRTFSKAYGLAGLRAGVLAGRAEQLAMVRRLASPYNVNGVALMCLPEALADQAFVQDYVAQVRSGRERLRWELKMSGIHTWPSAGNFVLASLGDRRVAFVEAMRRRGVLIRDRNSDPGCAGCVRITLGSEPDNRKLFAILPGVLAECGYVRTGGHI